MRLWYLSFSAGTSSVRSKFEPKPTQFGQNPSFPHCQGIEKFKNIIQIETQIKSFVGLLREMYIEVQKYYTNWDTNKKFCCTIERNVDVASKYTDVIFSAWKSRITEVDGNSSQWILRHYNAQEANRDHQDLYKGTCSIFFGVVL